MQQLLQIALMALMGLMITPASAQSVAQVATGIADPDLAVEEFNNRCINITFDRNNDGNINPDTIAIAGHEQIRDNTCAQVIWYLYISYRANSHVRRGYTEALSTVMHLWHERIIDDPYLTARMEGITENIQSGNDHDPYAEIRRFELQLMLDREESSSPSWGGVTTAMAYICVNAEGFPVSGNRAYCDRDDDLYWVRQIDANTPPEG